MRGDANYNHLVLWGVVDGRYLVVTYNIQHNNYVYPRFCFQTLKISLLFCLSCIIGSCVHHTLLLVQYTNILFYAVIYFTAALGFTL